MHIGTFQDCLTQRRAACVIIRPLDGDNDVGGEEEQNRENGRNDER